MIPRNIPSSGLVVRYHANPGPVQQNIAAHSWGVAMVILYYCPEPSVALLKAAMYHDTAESMVGDTPYPVKRLFPKLAAALQEAEDYAESVLMTEWASGLTPEELLWFKFADMMECFLWCRYLYEEHGTASYYDIAKAASTTLRAMTLPAGLDREHIVYDTAVRTRGI